jgi:hypothetical protein
MSNLSGAFKQDVIEHIPYCRARRHGGGRGEERRGKERRGGGGTIRLEEKLRVAERNSAATATAERAKRLGEMKVEIGLFWWTAQVQALVLVVFKFELLRGDAGSPSAAQRRHCPCTSNRFFLVTVWYSKDLICTSETIATFRHGW